MAGDAVPRQAVREMARIGARTEISVLNEFLRKELEIFLTYVEHLFARKNASKEDVAIPFEPFSGRAGFQLSQRGFAEGADIPIIVRQGNAVGTQ